jgi:hypothetical protein
MNVADPPSNQKSFEEAGSQKSGPVGVKTVGEGTELRSVQDVLSIVRNTRTLSREDYPARIATMRRVQRFFEAHPLESADAKALAKDLSALRSTPVRRSPAPDSDDDGNDPFEQLLKFRTERDQAWDELMQSLHGKSR